MHSVNIGLVRFEWDEEKNRENLRKHGVDFEEAVAAFKDQYAPCYFDPAHSIEEDRFILLGMSPRLRVLVVCHCYRAGGEIIRIITARKATENEEKDHRRCHAG